MAGLLPERFPDLCERHRQILFDKPARSRYLAQLRNRAERAAERVSLTGPLTVCF